MAPDLQRIKQHLQNFNFADLFLEELGWDRLNELPLSITIRDRRTFTLKSLVEKRGIKVYICDPNVQGHIPDDKTIRQVDLKVTREAAAEHLIIYVDAAREHQVWQWVRREPGKPLTQRTNKFHKGQSGESLADKLIKISFSLDEEESLTSPTVSGRIKSAFDVEKVTKRFYERFKKEHSAFMGFIDGITDQGDQEWYTSLMLNRLMFIYFIQKKGFLGTKSTTRLDGDTDYLRNHLQLVQAEKGQDQFHTFYRYFLLKLFHEGLNKRERSPEIEKLLGKVPYLNGGLFDIHTLESRHDAIQISDAAFERLFDFFDEYEWHLDDREDKKGNEINPDVLGYIFEKYINQKQMGAYYTKEDITGYISKNTIIPYLFESAAEKCTIAFEPGGPVWSLLRDNPDDYIYEAVAKGTTLLLPAEIEAGLNDISKRTEWNKPALEEYALPTEIWREVVARRTRHEEVRAKIAAGELASINDLITYNLDITKFARDVITYCEGYDLLLALYESIESITVLDPTCGSGAFLFAALNILEPLYEACLVRMQTKVDEREQLDARIEPSKRNPSYQLRKFQEIIKLVKKHHSREYFILKSIIIRNLYDVDIMEEAIEICRLRLFLKLVSQVQKPDDIEPLPDIDFNILAGNTLVGFASLDEVRQAVEKDLRTRMTSSETLASIERQAKEIERDVKIFRGLQTRLDLEHDSIATHKQDLRAKLANLCDILDPYLAAEYGIELETTVVKIDPKKKLLKEEQSTYITEKKAETYREEFAHWKQTHQPFHWFMEFFEIMSGGGFNVIIGNPPYIEYKNIREHYTVLNFRTECCNDIYAFTMERAKNLSRPSGSLGMIVPISIVSADGFSTLREYMNNKDNITWCLNFAERPAKLFIGAEKRLTIWLNVQGAPNNRLFLSNYRRWFVEERDLLFSQISYIEDTTKFKIVKSAIPKIATKAESDILHRLSKDMTLDTFFQKNSPYFIFYTRKLRYFVQFFDFIPKITNENGLTVNPSELKEIYLNTPLEKDLVLAILNSSLFFWFFNVYSDVRNVNRREIEAFRCSLDKVSNQIVEICKQQTEHLMEDFKVNSKFLTNSYGKYGVLTIQSFRPRLSKPIIDEIDRVLAKHYGFTDEELDFIINYDIKYRMGRDNVEEDEA